MPIRINLLAETQANEEIRRRDPVKRALWVAVVLVAAILVWSGSLQMEMMSDNAKAGQLASSLGAKTNEYTLSLNNEKKLADTKFRLEQLNRLATNRFLQSDLLNALQRATLDGVQLTKLRVDQAFTVVAPVKARHLEEGDYAAKPGSNMERILLALEARDGTANPGSEGINQFKDIMARNPWFAEQQVSTNSILLRDISAPLVDTESGSTFVQFKFECRFPDRNR